MVTIDASHIRLITDRGEFGGPFELNTEYSPIPDLRDMPLVQQSKTYYISQTLPIGQVIRYRVDGQISFVRHTGKWASIKRILRKLFRQKHDPWQEIDYIYATGLVLDQIDAEEQFFVCL